MLKSNEWTRSGGFAFRHPARKITRTTGVTGLLFLRTNHPTERLAGCERHRRNDQRCDHCDGNPKPLERAQANHTAGCRQLYTVVPAHASSERRCTLCLTIGQLRPTCWSLDATQNLTLAPGCSAQQNLLFTGAVREKACTTIDKNVVFCADLFS